MEQAPFHPAKERQTTLDEWILDDPEASFIMKMQGDSMNKNGIYHNDMLIIERTNQASNSDLVIIVKDGSWSIESYSELINDGTDKENFVIQAVVKALVRKYPAGGAIKDYE